MKDSVPKKRFIFDADVYYNTDFRDVDLAGLDSPEALMDTDRDEELLALSDYLGGHPSERFNVASEYAGNPILAHGSIGRWDGTRVGFSFFDDLGDMLRGSDSPFKDCEIQRIWDENGQLFITGVHHDGSATVELRQLSDDGIDAKEAIEDAWAGEPFDANGKTYDGSDQSVSEALHDLWESTEPPWYMERAYGLPAKEWEEPQRAADGHDLGDEEALGKAETEHSDRALGSVAKESRAAREGLAEDGRGEHTDPER